MATTDMDESIYFLKRFLSGPGKVASVWPSSRFLAEAMLKDLHFEDGDVVVEFGPGTGSFTRLIEARVDSGASLRYLGVEKDRGMHSYLRARFPHLDFVLGDALDLCEQLEERALPSPAAIISGLPLILFDAAVMHGIVANARAVLRPGGVFRTFSYLHSYPSRGAGDLRALMSGHFDRFTISRPVLRNVPPAVTLTGLAPAARPAGSPGLGPRRERPVYARA